MLALGLASKREITRTRIRVRTAMATQTASRAGTWAAARRTGTGSLMRDRTTLPHLAWPETPHCKYTAKR